jgi:hypothetical protein
MLISLRLLPLEKRIVQLGGVSRYVSVARKAANRAFRTVWRGRAGRSDTPEGRADGTIRSMAALESDTG